MHKAICTKVQGKTCVRQNTIMPIKLFGFFYFLCVFGFLTQKQVKNDKKEEKKNKQSKPLKTNKSNKNMLE